NIQSKNSKHKPERFSTGNRNIIFNVNIVNNYFAGGQFIYTKLLTLPSIWQAFFFNKIITFQLFGSFFIDYLC
ncbi:hypothetical protein ACFCV4_05075, partial [Enterococcus faecium]|uniref:hypothetical protein n=1 Tax=Enterococcus faecium TaxID=1352 RepID=UPI0035DA0B35